MKALLFFLNACVCAILVSKGSYGIATLNGLTALWVLTWK